MPRVFRIGPAMSRVLSPCGAQLGAKLLPNHPTWSQVSPFWSQVGALLAKFEAMLGRCCRMLQNVADMWCRNGPFRRCWADLCRSANGQITTASVHFLAACSIRECPARAAAPQWAEDCSSRSAPLLNYHASAPSVRADFIQQSSVLSCDCAFLPAKCMSGRLSFCWVI